MRIGYAPYDHTLDAPGDRRRFVSWARARGVEFEIVDAPRPDIDVAVVSMAADLVRWRHAPPGMRVIYDITDDYLGLPASGLRNRGRGVAKFASGELSRPTLRYRELMADMCRRADVVICTSPNQEKHVIELGGDARVVTILDCYDETSVDAKRTYASSDPPRIVWEGLPFNVGTLSVIGEAIHGLPSPLRPTVHVITPTTYRPYARRFGRRSSANVAAQALPGIAIDVHEWRQESLAELVVACDVAVIPLPQADPFAMSKSAQKLVSLWAMAMPVVTTATPAYEEAMVGAGLDLACRTTEDWIRALTSLLSHEDARRAAGRRGRTYVDQHASREATLRRWDEVVGASCPARGVSERG